MAISSSRGSPSSRDRTCVSYIGRWILCYLNHLRRHSGHVQIPFHPSARSNRNPCLPGSLVNFEDTPRVLVPAQTARCKLLVVRCPEPVLCSTEGVIRGSFAGWVVRGCWAVASGSSLFSQTWSCLVLLAAQHTDGAPLAAPNPTPKALGPCLGVREGLARVLSSSTKG